MHCLQSSHKSPQPAWEWKNSGDAVKAYTALLGFLALGQIPALRTVKFADLPYFIGLASMTIYIGAHRGLCTKVRQQITIKEVQNAVAESPLPVPRSFLPPPSPPISALPSPGLTLQCS